MNVLVDGAGNIKIVGTVLWRAPELINRNARDLFKANIYSLGLLLVELDTLKQPFDETGLTPNCSKKTFTRINSNLSTVVPKVSLLVYVPTAIKPPNSKGNS
ncbi:hypothetical protein THRCLA_20001 [Thraustotheca clavata]|uniref:Protein kinase domain-containing protein n=1 Tax=Thraustotheca clavata TaxID=74557 RepID=A0A1W0ADC1_9STRA|nr:hypothetical protein THRCLA_20001 [Thraustotheca clavata]